MKVIFKYGIGSFSGTIDQMVYRPSTSSNLGSISRKWVRPAATVQNETLGIVSQNLRDIWADCEPAYKADLKTYASRYNVFYDDGTDPFFKKMNAYSTFIVAIYAAATADPTHINLETITKADLASLGTKVDTVKNMVENGLIKSIPVFADLIAQW